jgi:PAS domain S-box-containing protein
MLKLNPLLSHKPPVILSYGVAVLSVMAALIILRWIETVFHSAPHVSLLLCAVMFSAWFGGVRPGLLAITLSALGFKYFFLPPIYSLAVETAQLPRLLSFALSASFVGLLSAAQRSTAVSLVQARDDLQRNIEALKAENIERERAEEKLREQASLLDLTHDTVFVRDMNDIITYWNHGAEEQYGWTSKEAVGRVSHQLAQTIFPAPLEEINAELLRRGRWEGELIHRKRDGTQVVVASRWALQRDAQGQAVAVLETNNDITERKRTEEALHKAQAELAHVTRVMTMGELTSSIAHEVNQPLTAVVTNGNACLRWLATQPPNLDEARESVGRIIRDGHRASEVIGRVRASFRKATPEKARLDINGLIQDVVALVPSEMRRNHILLRTELMADLPPVLGDRIQLQQVLLNLIINSIEAMSAVTDRPRKLLIRSQRHEMDGVLVAVEDSGVGIEVQNLAQLFDGFFTTKPDGLGMGLSISRSIIEAHSERLWATASQPSGAVFQFTLPVDGENQHD